MMRRILYGVFFFLLTLTAWSQGIADTTVSISGVEISGDRNNLFSTGSYRESIDSNTISKMTGQGLPELLLRNTLVYIKSNGPNGVSSLSVRGGTAAQTAVIWNGFNIQSPMNGGTDLSLFPLGMADEVILEYGGTGALYGSGSMSGSLLLNRKPAYGSGFKLRTGSEISSYQYPGGHLLLERGGRKSYSTLRAFAKGGLNNIRYLNESRAGHPEERLIHARAYQWGLMAGCDLKIRKSQEVSADLSYLSAEREIPPLMIQSSSAATLSDQQLRARAEWKTRYGSALFMLRTAFSKEDQHYLDSLTRIDSDNDFISSGTEAEARISFGPDHLLNIGLNYSREQANTGNYQSNVHRDRMALLLNYRYRTRHEKLVVSASVRTDYNVPDYFIPLPSVGLETKLWKGSTLRFRASRIYRHPTLNDLYWNPGGDPDLLPEQGFTEELGYSQNWSKDKKWSTDLHVSIYNSNVRDWILWLPSGYFWTPRNVQEVWSRGLDARSVWTVSIKSWMLGGQLRYQYTRATYCKTVSAGDASKGKQLPYTPIHTSSVSLMVKYKNLELNYLHSYMGWRYLSSDNAIRMKPYFLGNIEISWHLRVRNSAFHFGFSVDNLWDDQYQSIVWMPMPGRVFRGSLYYQLNHSLKP